ncbi:hypothetical protein BC937DRAFT_93325 [Endogone sp. FLAS-F59071]|nr:hypothetical protein BC937DRAFT_93325 [Endogone sp. FLAS-F59071]|eukprot:RUS23381.1 hypothetical protein BC937DRAFT_93325 [Endogone sp. FLAS-F59071]
MEALLKRPRQKQKKKTKQKAKDSSSEQEEERDLNSGIAASVKPILKVATHEPELTKLLAAERLSPKTPVKEYTQGFEAQQELTAVAEASEASAQDVNLTDPSLTEKPTHESRTLFATSVRSDDNRDFLASLQKEIDIHLGGQKHEAPLYPTIPDISTAVIATAPPLFDETPSEHLYPSVSDVEASAPPFHYIMDVEPAPMQPMRRLSSAPYLQLASESVLNTRVTAVEALSEEDLKSFYVNQQLEDLPEKMDIFWAQAGDIYDAFYSRVRNFEKAHGEVQTTKLAIYKLQNTARNIASRTWIIESKTEVTQAKCGDGADITHTYSYQVAKYQASESSRLAKVLAKLREEANTRLYRFMYESKLAKLWVQNYIDDFIWDSPVFQACADDVQLAGLSSKVEPNQFREEVSKLKHMLDVLFYFEIIAKRRIDFESRQQETPEDEKGSGVGGEGEQAISVFVRDIRGWISHLASALLRVATNSDRRFIFLHALRCNGIAEWGAGLIQCPLPDKWTDDFVDEYLLLIHLLLNPTDNHGDGELGPSISEKSKRTPVLSEDDYLVILDQFNIPAFFDRLVTEHLLRFKDADSVSPNRAADRFLLRLFAVSNDLLRTLTCALSIFPREQFPNLIKRVAQIVSQVSRILGSQISEDGGKRSETMLSVGNHKTSVQVELDIFIVRTLRYFMALPGLGVWHFLTAVPFHVASVNALWKIFCDILGVDSITPFSAEAFTEQLPSTKSLIHVISSNQVEGEFLLACLTKMATPINPSVVAADQSELATCLAVGVAHVLFDIAYLDVDLREQFYKSVRDSFSNICGAHPIVMSMLLRWVMSNFSAIGQMGLYLFRALPLEKWPVATDDLKLLHDLLCRGQLTSPESQFARFVTEHINWGFRSDNGLGDERKVDSQQPWRQRPVLFLTFEVHQEMALLITDLCRRLQPAHDGERSNHYVATITSAVSNYVPIGGGVLNLTTDQAKREYLDWCWKIVLLLKLYDCPVSKRAVDIDPEVMPHVLSNIPNVTDLSVSQTALLTYVSFMLSDSSRSFLRFEADNGWQKINFLIKSGQGDPVIRILSEIIPSFIYMHGDDLFNDEHMTDLLVDLVNLKSDPMLAMAASRYVAWNKATPLVDKDDGLSGIQIIIGSHAWQAQNIDNAYQLASESGEGFSYLDLILHSWLRTIFSLKDWFWNTSCVSIVDYISKLGLILQRQNLVRNLLMEELKKITDGPFQARTPHHTPGGSPRGAFQYVKNILPDVLTTNGYPSLLVGDYSMLSYATNNLFRQPGVEAKSTWFAFEELIIETLVEKDSRREFALYLWEHSRDKSSGDMTFALKSGVQAKKPLEFFTVYRWLQHALILPPDHPLLPLFLQMFFCLYFANFQPRTTHERFFYGHLFFSRRQEMLDKLRDRIAFLQTYHGQKRKMLIVPSGIRKSAPQEGSSLANSSLDHEKLHGLYYAMWLWLRELKLTTPEYSLDDLPEQFCSPRLQACRDADPIGHSRSLWIELVPIPASQLWFQHFPWVGKSKQVADERNSEQTKRAPERSDSSRGVFVAPAQPPPAFALRKPLTSLSEDIRQDSNAEELFRDVVRIMKQHGRRFLDHIAQHKSLDSSYIHQLQSLYHNELKRSRLEIPCSKVPSGICKSPAVFTMQHEELQQSTNVRKVLVENRREVENFTFGTVDSRVCIQALVGICTVEKIAAAVEPLGNSLGNDEILEKLAFTSFEYLFQQFALESKTYPPAMIFLQSMVRTLGTHLGKQPSLVEFIVDLMDLDEHKVKLLHPIFNPALSLQKFVELYRRISDSSTYSLKCQSKLLPRFDGAIWTQSVPLPSAEERYSCYSIAFGTMKKAGKTPTVEQSSVLKSHWRLVSSLMKSDVTDYVHVLAILLDTCASGTVEDNILDSFVSALGFKVESPPSILDNKQDIQPLTSSHISKDSMCVIVDFLESYFTNAEHNHGSLYRNYGPHIPAIIRLLTVILGDRKLMIDLPVVGQGWTSLNLIRRAYNPWLLSLTGNQTDRRKQTDKSDPSAMEQQQREIQSIITSFVALVKKLVDVREKASVEILQSLWNFYVALIKTDFLTKYAVILHEQLEQLPWGLLAFDSARLKLILELRVPLSDSLRVEFLRFVAFQLQSWVSSAPKKLSAYTAMEDFTPLIAYLLLLVVQDVDEMYTDEEPQVQLLNSLDQNIVHSLKWISLGEDDYTGIVNELKTSWRLPLNLSVSPNRPKSPSVQVCFSWLRTFGNLDNASHVNVRELKTYALYVLSVAKQSISVNDTRFTESVLLSTIHDLLRMIDDASSGSDDPLHIPVEIQDILQNALSLLNNCVKDSHIFDLVWQGLNDAVEHFQHLPLTALAAACHGIASIRHMVLLIETCIQRYFNIAKDHTPWSLVSAVLVIPELESAEFLHQCLETSSLFTLYAHCLQDLDRCGGSPAAELEVIEEMAAFISATKPPEVTGQTTKAILLVAKFAEALATQELGEELRDSRLVPGLISIHRSMTRWFEDKDSRGIFGTLGLGSRSPYDPEFRLFARAVATFLATRLADAGVEGHSDFTGLVETLITLPIKNKEYMPLKRTVDYAVQVVQDKEKKIKWMKELVIELIRRLFPTDSFLYR